MVFQALLTGSRPRICWRDSLGTSQEELQDVAGEKDVWANLVG